MTQNPSVSRRPRPIVRKAVKGGISQNTVIGPILGLIVAMAVVAWLGLHLAGYRSDWFQLIAATTISVLLSLLGISRSKVVLGRLDFFHPLVFPLAYTTVSFLAPVWVTFISGYAVGSLSRDNAVATNTPFLLCLGVAGFAAGAAIPFRAPAYVSAPTTTVKGTPEVGTAVTEKPSRRRSGNAISRQESGLLAERRVLGKTMLAFGRLLAVATLVLLLYQLLTGGVLSRGLDQTHYTISDTIAVLTKLLPTAAVVLACAGNAVLESPKLLTRIDVSLLALIVVGIGARGSRNTAIAIILMVLFIYTRRAARVRWRVIVIGFLFALVLMLVVLNYRNSIRGVEVDKTWWAILLGDLAPAAFSVGVVAAVVPSSVPYTFGSTIIAAVVRQIPGPVAVALFGEPTETGSRIFRDIAGVNNVNTGVGFSIPAEGYLNFGVPGLVLLCFLLALGLSWFYARTDIGSGKVTRMIYPILIGVLPMALRSDLLGAIKLALYPALLVLGAVIIGQSIKPLVRAQGRPFHGSPKFRRVGSAGRRNVR